MNFGGFLYQTNENHTCDIYVYTHYNVIYLVMASKMVEKYSEELILEACENYIGCHNND